VTNKGLTGYAKWKSVEALENKGEKKGQGLTRGGRNFNDECESGTG
jgi:hypothetical protein